MLLFFSSIHERELTGRYPIYYFYSFANMSFIFLCLLFVDLHHHILFLVRVISFLKDCKVVINIITIAILVNSLLICIALYYLQKKILDNIYAWLLATGEGRGESKVWDSYVLLQLIKCMSDSQVAHIFNFNVWSLLSSAYISNV
jgi:hypothetical protein